MQFMPSRIGPGAQGSSTSAAGGAPAGHHHHHHHHHHHIVHRHHPQASTPNGIGVGGPASRPMSPLSQAQSLSQHPSHPGSSAPQSAQLSPRIPHPTQSVHEAPGPSRPHSGSSTTEIINLNPNPRQPLWRPEDGKRFVKESATAPPGGSNILGPHERLMTPFVMTPAQAHQHQVSQEAQDRSSAQSRRSSFNGNGGPAVVNEFQTYRTSPPEIPRRSSIGGSASSGMPVPMPIPIPIPAPIPVKRQASPVSSRNTRLPPPPSPSTSSNGRPGTAGAGPTTPLTPFGPPPPPHMVSKGMAMGATGSSVTISPTSKMAVSTISPAMSLKMNGPEAPPTNKMISMGLEGMSSVKAISGPVVSSNEGRMSPSTLLPLATTTTASVMTGPGVAPVPVTSPPLNVQNAHVESPPTPSTRAQQGSVTGGLVSPVAGGAESGSGLQVPFLPAPTPLSMMVSVQSEAGGSNGANGVGGSGTGTPAASVAGTGAGAGVKVGKS